MWKKLFTSQVIDTSPRLILFTILLVIFFEPVGNSFKADTDKWFFGLSVSDSDIRSDKFMRSNKDTDSDTHMFETEETRMVSCRFKGTYYKVINHIQW